MPSIEKKVDHLFRHHSGQLMSTLTRIFGVKYIDEIESIVQEAFLKACQKWPYTGIPDNPLAWLTTVAKNATYDLIKKDHRAENLKSELENFYSSYPMETSQNCEWVDDILGMMFICCDPILSKKSQICLTLKTVSGFSVHEISSAFISSDEATKRLITRAKEKISKSKLSLEFPSPNKMKHRIDSVMEVLYLIFNEGYNASSGKSPIRQVLCDEAIRLAEFLLHDSFKPGKKIPKIKALLALMLLHSAKNPARIDENNQLVLLQDQNRSFWDEKRISLGLKFLGESSQGDELSTYHLEAHIVACHIMAENYESADWPLILKYYDLLISISPSPIVKMNRSIALGMVMGAEFAIDELLELTKDKKLKKYHLIYAVIAEFYYRNGNGEVASKYFRKALALARTDFERKALEKKLLNNFNS